MRALRCLPQACPTGQAGLTGLAAGTSTARLASSTALAAGSWLTGRIDEHGEARTRGM